MSTSCGVTAQSNDEYGGIPYDARPMEAIELSGKRARTGDVFQVKPIGALAMVEGMAKLSWKLLVVASDSQLARDVHDVSELGARLPDAVSELREWLRWCTAIRPGEQADTTVLLSQSQSLPAPLPPMDQCTILTLNLRH